MVIRETAQIYQLSNFKQWFRSNENKSRSNTHDSVLAVVEAETEVGVDGPRLFSPKQKRELLSIWL
jgi:hypothetical protein